MNKIGSNNPPNVASMGPSHSLVGTIMLVTSRLYDITTNDIMIFYLDRVFGCKIRMVQAISLDRCFGGFMGSTNSCVQ